MAGKTQQNHAVKELGTKSKQQDEGTAVEQRSDKTTEESSEHFSSTDTDARAGSREPKLDKVKKERGGTQQREAVIRPQQAGKIDFSSLQNRSKFATDRTWSSGKGSPQSPSGKGRGRDKSKRSGKTERGNTQHLYSLSITNPRSNLNIGIAYPQQKVSPATKLDTARGPVSGSYRFHTPSIPEREVEIQQEELNFSHSFQEASSNLTSPSYTSQALGSSSGSSSHQHLPVSQKQQSAAMENSIAQSGSQLILTDFQLNASNAWQSPERTFIGANYASSQKSTAHTDTNKTNNIVPGSFQYGYNFLEESTSDSFPCEHNPQSQDFTDSSLGSVHGTHNSCSFLPVEGPSVAQNNTKFSNEQQPETRSSYPHTQQSQFIQGVASSVHCPRNLSDDSASSDSTTVSIPQQSDHGKTALPEGKDNPGQVNGKDSAGIKRNCAPKDTTANQRTHIQASVQHTRNILHSQGTQMHFLSKTLNSSAVNHVHTGTVQFDKNINNKVLNGLTQSWEGPSKTFLPVAQNTIQYSDVTEKFQFQNQSAPDKRINLSKDNRMPWQPIRPPTANQNQVSRQISNQKVSYIVSPSEWQDDCKSHKNSLLKTSGSFPNSRTSDGFSNQRQETVKQVSTFKVEMSHAQLSETKNKALYFGLNQSIPVTSSRSYSYPPIQVPPMSLMMVSPYESPLPSPAHTPASSSTCSSLSPVSTSPVNSTSEDSQMSKSGTPLPFYQQPAQSKTQLAPDHLNTHPHQFHAETQRNLTYAPDRDKDNMMRYLQNNTQSKTTIDGSKGYMDSFGMEHHQPPPPYSAHQLFATSLANANLDQLDVLLTCKQCDQNFHNVASFLGHKQYCTQPNMPKIEDNGKFHTEPAKAVLPASNVSMSRCPSDLHLSLLGLNKNGELISESEAKADCKDDPMKLNLFSGSGSHPVPLPELEMEDAKLDSLITEALNGLGYQSDNAEIDSSFIDAFVDDDLNTVKLTNKQCVKTKESVLFENKDKQAADDSESSTQKYFYDTNHDSQKRNTPYNDNKLEKTPLNFEHDKKTNIKKETSPKNPKIASRENNREQASKGKEARKVYKSEDESTNTPRFLLSSKFSERCAVKSVQDSSALIQTSTSPTSRTAVKESKRRSTGGGTWSKELIHKIVQQKNKINKLHVKGSKNLQFSLVMERLTPTVQNPAFGEYDYVSDTDDECEPVKIASQGRLNQSSRCKYTYTKECKWRARSERDQAAWRHESKECFEVKKSEEISLSPEKHSSYRHKRRGSRSSTCSELSTSVSVSSDSINSPKSIERTELDCERKADIKKKDSPERKSNERCSPQKSCKDTGTLALTFTKSVKRCNTDGANIFGNKHSTENPTQYFPNAEIVDTRPSSAVTSFEKESFSKANEAIYHRKENAPTVTSSKNALECTDNLHSKEEDNKPLQFHSHSPTCNKETDPSIDKGTKVKRRQRPHSTQIKVSENTTFKEQSNSVCMAKEAISLVNELHTQPPASLCTTLMDEVCLSPSRNQGPLIQKDGIHLMPYSMDQDQDQGLIKSPLTFDTSSMFGDLAAFDSGLYSDMPKESFHSLENTIDKKEEFVSSFSPFLEQRDWNLIVSPVLPDEISQYKGSFDKGNEKKPDYSDVTLSLPEKIIDYSANLNSCASEDELEIKRIVNELENQLQTTKMETPLRQEDPKQLQMSKFSPLRLSEESENDTIDAPVPSETFTEPELPWSSPFQFDLVDRHNSPHSTIHSEAGTLEQYTETETDVSNTIIPLSPLHNDRKPEERNTETVIASETKDVLEQNQYTEKLMKNLEVISDSLFKNKSIISEHREPNVTFPASPQQESECGASDLAVKENHSEKEAITGAQNTFSPSNIREQKDNVEFILKESHSSLPHDTDHTIDVHQQITSQPSEPSENGINKVEMEFISDGLVPEESKLIESSHCSSVLDTHADEDSNTDRTMKVVQLSCNSPRHVTVSYEETDANNNGQLSSLDICKSTGIVVKTGEQSTDSHLNPKNVDLIKCEQSESTTKSRHSLVNHNVSLKPDLSVDVVSTSKPYSPILVEGNTEHSGTSITFQDIHSIGPNSQLVFIQKDSINDNDAKSSSFKSPQLNDSLKTEPSSAFNSIHKPEDILNVHDIREDLPVDFMASHQNSPCREDVEGGQCSFLHTYSPSSPLLATQTEMDIGDTQQSKYKSGVDQNSVQKPTSPAAKPEHQTEDCDETATAEIEYLISPPHLELPNSDTNIPSPLPVSCTVEPPVLLNGLDKGDSSYDFKLSPLNNKNNSDEPPQLTQYDYIPISSSLEAPVIDGLNYRCFSLGLASEDQCTNSSAGIANEDVKDRPGPDDSIKLTLLRKVESSSLAEAESTALPMQNISDCLLSPKSPILSESGPAVDLDECFNKVTSPKMGHNNPQQGKVLCEICFMCFRTVPGLKRHKVMKHMVRNEKPIGPQSTTVCHQGTSLIYEASQEGEKEHKDDSQPYRTRIDEMTETNGTLILKESVPESSTNKMAADTSTVARDETGNDKPVLLPKSKKNSKVRKNKNNEENSKLDPFSDDLLNMLKTDLLQAITPDFKSNGLQEQEHPERHRAETEKTLHCLTSNSGTETASRTKETTLTSETVGFNGLTDIDQITCTGLIEEVKVEGCTKGEVENTPFIEEITEEHNVNSQCLVEEVSEHKHSEGSITQEDLKNVSVEVKCEQNSISSDKQHSLTCLSPAPLTPSGITPDLKALLDDDTIFSQLFPRDEDAKRKKCPRVYSKRNKKQKLSSDSDVTQDGPPPPEAFTQDTNLYIENPDVKAFSDNPTKPCEYATISIDDTIMLNMCHNNTLKVPDVTPVSDGKQSDQEYNTKELSINPLNPFQIAVDKTPIEWSGIDAEPIVTPEPVICKADAPNTPGDVYTVEQSVSDSGHSIDIQNINTTFQLPEIQFFESNKDVTVAPPPASTDVENKDDEKSKKPTDRRGRKRQEGGMKVKDKQYKCKVCFTWFLTLGELNFHKLSHNPSPPPTCYMCVQRKFSSREQLRDHLWEKHAKNKTGIWTCGMCLKEISDVWMYNEHLREHATQFARRGQTQGSMLAIPGCFMQETAVKNFITSIMQHRPNKGNRESSKATKDQEKAFTANGTLEDEKTSVGPERKLNKPKSSSGRGSSKNTLTPLEVLHKTEAPKNVEMHPNCKDPSRDCHHCGKRFPKPFKLQRHLVVHNLEKIFLCHRCPVSYQEAQDLKEHLKTAHEETGEPDSKHTTLYTCELCADVMHVIKKSFICSTCNYTFSKKEQFDRHMEKHLSGGNKIFKFRGVHRPVKTSLPREDDCDSPASKKRRIISDSQQENSTDSGIASVCSLHHGQTSDTAKVSMLDDSTQTPTYDYRSDTNVKTEDIADDYSVLLVELEKCISVSLSESAAPKEEEIDQTPAANLDKEANGESTAEVKEEKESVCIRVETTKWPASQQNCSEGEEQSKADIDSASGHSEKSESLPSSKDFSSSLREHQVTAKRPEPQLAFEMTEQQREDERHPQRVSRQQAELKDKGGPIRSSVKVTDSTQVLHSKSSPNTNEDKETQRSQKKRKDVKSPNCIQRVSSPATQENFVMDSRPKKKYHPSKCLNPSMQRKSDAANDYAVFSSVRDDVVGNKLVSKCKTSTLGLQLKRSLLDSCTPKKADMVAPLGRDYKSKKGHVGRPLHTSISKVPSVPMNNSLNKSRPKQEVRSVESHSYRTAESQNHLLSQLFGQKLTSFKIPLRKDTSESIN
ncbi:zinc finger protein 469 [Nerophis ophidion]|uniref:zinc finger protein 469 n=1 Tax=Nerophis ophidion TaxID=159077 RepID=UPI002ADFA4CE|nr:zinc finger protein 469 [Nerophis ophidion]XP_061773512.1 zinc finger protein 469 [Nerophis ophidion]